MSNTIKRTAGTIAATAVGIALAGAVTGGITTAHAAGPLCQYDRTGSTVYVFAYKAGTAVVQVPGPNPSKTLRRPADPSDYQPGYRYAKFRLDSRSTKVSGVVVKFSDGTRADCERT